MCKLQASECLPLDALAHGLFSPNVVMEQFLSALIGEPDRPIEVSSSIHVSSSPVKRPGVELPKAEFGESYRTTPSRIQQVYQDEWYRQLELIKPFVNEVVYEFGYWLRPEITWPAWVRIYQRLARDKEQLKPLEAYLEWEELVASVEAAVVAYRLPKSFGGLPDIVDRQVWVGELVHIAEGAVSHHPSSFLLVRRLFIRPLLLVLSHFRTEHKIGQGNWMPVEVQISSTELLASPGGIRAAFVELCERMSAPGSDAFELLERSLRLGSQLETQWCKGNANISLTLLLVNPGLPACRIFAVGLDLPEVSQFPLELSDGRKINLPFPPWRAAFRIDPNNDLGG